MIEKFRKWKMSEFIRIKYTDDTGAKKVWEANQEELLGNIQRIVTTYMTKNIMLTNRQLYYQLVAEGRIPNALEIYKRICKFITDARYAGLIDWEAIEDRGRVATMPSEWGNVNELIRSAVHSYRLPRWKDQHYYVELYCEKEAMASVLKPIADKYHIYFGSNKGYSSASAVYNVAQRVKEQLEEDKKVIILYLGDHDPSGLDMIRDIRDRIEEFVSEGSEYIEPNFEVIQIALTMEQIKKYNPPPNPAKITDPRAKGYIIKYGKVSWELDSLKPEILIDMAEQKITEYLDMDKYNNIMRQETKEIRKLVDFGQKLAGENDSDE